MAEVKVVIEYSNRNKQCQEKHTLGLKAFLPLVNHLSFQRHSKLSTSFLLNVYRITQPIPLLKLSLPSMSSRWKIWLGPIRSCLSYHETRAEPSSISISFCFRPMKEQCDWWRRKLREVAWSCTSHVDNLLCLWEVIFSYTGSFRKNGKSNLLGKITIFTQIKFSLLFQVQN